MNTAKTIREAVTEAVKWGSDYWANNLEEGALRDAVVKNRIGGQRGEILADNRVMDMATRHGRCIQCPGA